MKIKVNLCSVNNCTYVDTKATYCLNSLCNFTNIKDGFDWRISQSSESCAVLREMRSDFAFLN